MPQAITLECGNVIWIPIELNQQYPDDYHYVLCPHCIKLNRDVYGRKGYTQGIAWKRVVRTKTVVRMPDVSRWDARILPKDIIRIQPSVTGGRVTPFPYKWGPSGGWRIK
jgi:hypothetical protein